MTEIESGRLLPSKILVKQAVKEEKIVGGIIIPTVVKDHNVRGTVVARGDGVTANTSIAMGVTVIFSPNACQRVILDDNEYLLLDSKDVLFYF